MGIDSGAVALTVNGNNSTTMEVNDAGNARTPQGPLFPLGSTYQPIATTFTIDAGLLTRVAYAFVSSPYFPPLAGFTTKIAYGRLANLTVDGGPAVQVTPTTYQVLNTPGNAPVTINAHGTDAVTVGDTNNTINGIQSAVTVNGNNSTTLSFNDLNGTPGAAPDHAYGYSLGQNSLGQSTFNRTGTATVTFSGIATLTLQAANAAGSGGENVMSVLSTAVGTTYNLYAGTGFNEFNVYDYNQTLNSIRGPLNLHGAGGSLPNDDLVTLADVDRSNRHTFRVNAGATAQSGIVERFSDQAMLNPDMATISYDGLNAYSVLYTGVSAGHTINVQSQASNLFTYIGVGSSDTVNIGSTAGTLDTMQGELQIQANAGQRPTVNVNDSADSQSHTIDLSADTNFPYLYLVTGLFPHSSGLGQLWFELDPSAPVSIKTGSGDDTFRPHDFTVAPAISIFAEPAGSTRPNQHNKLDYSQYTGTVQVNLPLGTATGFAHISGIQDVTGGNGNNLLVGDANPNILIGGTGRNIIIGGGGGDRITGGGGDNILIAGSTLYDQKQGALNAIFAEWTSSDSLATRMADISGATPSGLDLNGSFVLVPASTPAHAATVFDDAAVDQLFDGTGLSWFFVHQPDDVINNGAGPSVPGDVVAFIRP
jgi:hypothetical protein